MGGIRDTIRRRRRERGGRAPDEVIDLRDDAASGLEDRVYVPEPDPEVLARLRFEAEVRAARAELEARRRWHWSGERIVEEGRRGGEWWEESFADPYAILELLPGASWEEISAARRRIARECHPDALIGRDESTIDDEDLRIRKMAAANDAYERLRRAVRV